jgi:hypothetical protein
MHTVIHTRYTHSYTTHHTFLKEREIDEEETQALLAAASVLPTAPLAAPLIFYSCTEDSVGVLRHRHCCVCRLSPPPCTALTIHHALHSLYSPCTALTIHHALHSLFTMHCTHYSPCTALTMHHTPHSCRLSPSPYTHYILTIHCTPYMQAQSVTMGPEEVATSLGILRSRYNLLIVLKKWPLVWAYCARCDATCSQPMHTARSTNTTQHAPSMQYSTLHQCNTARSTNTAPSTNTTPSTISCSSPLLMPPPLPPPPFGPTHAPSLPPLPSALLLPPPPPPSLRPYWCAHYLVIFGVHRLQLSVICSDCILLRLCAEICTDRDSSIREAVEVMWCIM